MTRPKEPVAFEGDIVVTRVAHHYTLGRIAADGRTQAYLESIADEVPALRRAGELAGNNHRVFHARPGRRTSALIDCTERARAAAVVRQLRPWQRRHVTGVITEVTPIPGMGSWEISVKKPGTRELRLLSQYSLLTDAHDAADRHVQSKGAHDCSACEQWMPIERRMKER